MKKVLFSIAIMAIAAIGMVSCGNNGKDEKKVPDGVKVAFITDTYEGDTMKVSTDFYLPENAGVKEIKVFDSSERCKTFADSVDNYKITIRLSESSTYPNNKASNKERESETYKEFKVGNYDAYAYEGHKTYYVTILFENISETTDRFLEMELSQLMNKSDGPGGKEFFEQNEEVKSIINSMVYNGVVKFDPAKGEVVPQNKENDEK